MERRRFVTLVSMGVVTGTGCRRSPESSGANRTALVLPTDGELRMGAFTSVKTMVLRPMPNARVATMAAEN